MGSEESGQQKLKFVQCVQDSHFGQIQIYRCNEGKFLMLTRRTHITGDKRYHQFKAVMQFAITCGYRGVVPVVSVSHQRERNICIQYEITSVYTEYFNYTLRDLMGSKKDVEESDMWFLMEVLLELVVLLKQNQLGINISINNVFLTLKGIPVVYLYHILPFEEYISSNEHGMAEQVGRIVLEMTAGEKIQEGESEGKQLMAHLGRMCRKWKLLGKAVKQLVKREKNQNQILEQIRDLTRLNRIKKATEIQLNKFKYIIPQVALTSVAQTQFNPQHITPNKVIDFKPLKRKSHCKQPLAQKLPHNESIQSSKVSQTHQSNQKFGESSRVGIMKTEQEQSTCKVQQFNKSDISKMLMNIDKKKQENRQQKEKLLIRKEALMMSSDKQNNGDNLTYFVRESTKSNHTRNKKCSQLKKQGNI